jgi:hypothetical protein
VFRNPKLRASEDFPREYEAPAPIGQEAEPAAVGRSRKMAEAVTA